MSKQNHSYDITQVSVQKTHDFGTMAAAWQVFWGRSSLYIKCHRSTEVKGAVTTYTQGGSALLCTILVIIKLQHTQSPGCATITASSALQTASWTVAQWIAKSRGWLSFRFEIRLSSGYNDTNTNVKDDSFRHSGEWNTEQTHKQMVLNRRRVCSGEWEGREDTTATARVQWHSARPWPRPHL